jgi:hypothetical protein
VVDDDLALQVALLQLLQHAVTCHVICKQHCQLTVGVALPSTPCAFTGLMCTVPYISLQ